MYFYKEQNPKKHDVVKFNCLNGFLQFHPKLSFHLVAITNTMYLFSPFYPETEMAKTISPNFMTHSENTEHFNQRS